MRTDALPFVKPPLRCRAPGGLFFFDIFLVVSTKKCRYSFVNFVSRAEVFRKAQNGVDKRGSKAYFNAIIIW